MREHGRLVRLEALMLSDQLADLLNLPPKSSGSIIKSVARGSPADEIGLRVSSPLVNISGHEVPLGGDILLSVEGGPGGGRQSRQGAQGDVAPVRRSRSPSCARARP